MSELYYDIEAYKGRFVCVLNRGNGYEKFDVTQLTELRKALSGPELMVSFNGISYDNIVLGYAFWRKGRGLEVTNEIIYNFSKHLIEETPVDRHAILFMDTCVNSFSYKKLGQVRTSRRLKRAGVWADIETCDLYLIGDKRGSLKQAAVALALDGLEETPFDWDKDDLTQEESDMIDSYCAHDVLVTEEAFKWSLKNIKTRKKLAALVGVKNALALGSASLAEKYFVQRAENEIGDRARTIFEEFRAKNGAIPSGKSLTEMIRCPRPVFKDPMLAAHVDRIYTYSIDFKHNPESHIETWTEDDYEGVTEWRKDDLKPTMLRTPAGSIVPSGALVVADSHGHEYQFGVGGLHDDAKKGVWRSEEGKSIVIVDVKSYYPSMITKMNIHPAHFKSYARYMKDILDIRFAAKADPARADEADSLKLAANSSFGKLKDKYSLLYDPRAHFSVTLTGQIGLLYLIDLIYDACDGVEVINANTDGVCFYLSDDKRPQFDAACRAWEKHMGGLELETDRYLVWAQSTCNLYCAKHETKKKPKAKGGDFKLGISHLGEALTKSTAIKTMTVLGLLEGFDPSEVALKLKAKHYLMSVTSGKKTHLLYDGQKLSMKVVRYYIAKDGKPLQMVTAAGPRRVAQGLNVRLADTLDSIEGIDFDWYIRGATDRILDIRGLKVKKSRKKGA